MKVLFAGCLATALLSGVPAAQEEEPEINGRPVSQWVKQLRSENRGLQLRAARTLASVPADLRERIVPLVMRVLKSDRDNDKFAAAQVLGEYGPAARAAVPDLLPMLQGTQ
jgi:HEAT repeat protein